MLCFFVSVTFHVMILLHGLSFDALTRIFMCNKMGCIGFEEFTTLKIRTAVFWVVAQWCHNYTQL
jgi:hypothetical protein